MEVIQSTDKVQFDVWSITVDQVTQNGEQLKWEVQSPNPAIGSVLIVQLNSAPLVGSEIEISIDYTTMKTGQAFSWLTAEQTAGKKLPYMFTQCEDINCRSVAPLQDTPANRITYEAHVTVDNGLVVKMSANDTGVTPVGFN